MYEKIKSVYSLFQVGKEVANPEKWKKHQITATALGATLIGVVAVLKSFGVDLPIDGTAATEISAGVIAVFNIVFTVVTSKKVGYSEAQK